MNFINKTHVGDCRDVLKAMAKDKVKVQMCVTSPPYWNLRNYGYDGQIGLEPTIAEYVREVVKVFRGVRNVLTNDGLIFVNMGDGYVSVAGSHERQGANGQMAGRTVVKARAQVRDGKAVHDKVCRPPSVKGLATKNMIGMPWRIAFALQRDGWYLRSDIIWAKPNPMPESVTDRPTKSHEYIFMLAAQERYYYDASAISEPVTGGSHARGNGVNPKSIKMPDGWATHPGGHGTIHKDGREAGKTHLKQDAGAQVSGGDRMTGFNDRYRSKQNASFSGSVNELVDVRNARTVWTMPTEAQPAAHFACFPHELARRCILAGSRPGDTIIDPFMGSGTTARAAASLGRHFIGIEMSAAYAAIQHRLGIQTGMPL